MDNIADILFFVRAISLTVSLYIEIIFLIFLKKRALFHKR